MMRMSLVAVMRRAVTTMTMMKIPKRTVIVVFQTNTIKKIDSKSKIIQPLLLLAAN